MAKDAASAALLKPTTERGRNNFPLDQKHVYSMKAGQITPVKALHFMPGDFFKIQAHDFSLTFPMNTAAFLRGRKETAFYSVYYNAVWSLFNQYMATRQDPKTSAFGNAPSLVEPRIRLFDLYNACLNQFARYLIYTYLVEPWYHEQFPEDYASETEETRASEIRNYQKKWLDTLLLVDTSSTRHIWNLTSDISDVTDVRLGFDFYSDSTNPIDRVYMSLAFDWGSSRNTLTFEDFQHDIVGHERVYSWVRKLDMLGYGNLYPMFNYSERALIEFISTHSSVSNPYTQAQTFFAGVIKSLAYTIIRQTFTGYSNMSTAVPKYVNLYSICAYNSVFYHFFRNSYYDLNYSSHDYSLDFVSSLYGDRSSINQVYLSDFSLRFLDIEYHQWKKDLFTSLLPDTQFGAVSSISIQNVSLTGSATLNGSTGPDSGRWLTTEGSSMGSNLNVATNSSGTTLIQQNPNVGIYHTHNLSGSASISSSASIPNAFDVIQLKRAEMLQKYRQTLMRAGNKTSDIFRAIYGGAPSSEHEDDVIPRFLETFGEDLFVDPVISTASTGNDQNGELGDIAARAKFRGDSKTFKFNAGMNFGVILCLSYVVPESEYNSYMLDKHNLELSPEQHFLPAYENWGLEPVYSDELNSMIYTDQVRVLGYASRYYHKKCSFDLVHGAFVSSAAYGVIGSAFVDRVPNHIDYFGEFNHWVSPRTELQSRTTTTLRDFYINPSVLDNVFVRKAGADIADDQFICNTYFEIQSTRAMSKVGLINFV